jgi:Fur family transcriptional regulator, zinc uptake regulator
MLASQHNHAKCTAALIARAEQTCAASGARLTDQRREILTCVAQSHAAVGAYDVIERMAARGPRPAPITVYRALDFLLSHNLVHKIESRNAFVACACVHDDAQPALLICDGCGNVDEIVPPAANEDLQRAASAQGFKVNRAVIELSGTCHQCANV